MAFAEPAQRHMAIGRLESEAARHVQNSVEVEADGGAGLLGHLVLDGQVEVVRSVEQALQRALVLREDGGANARDVVQVNAAQREMAQIFAWRDLDVAELVAEGR